MQVQNARNTYKKQSYTFKSLDYQFLNQLTECSLFLYIADNLPTQTREMVRI